MSGEPLARRFADWGAGLRLSRVPAAVRGQALRAVLDTVGVIACGASHPAAALARASFAGAPGPCTVAGGRPSTAAAAALANGAAAHAWDLDDTSYTGIMHASAVIFPAVLAAAEESGLGGDGLLTAFIVGSEVAYTLAETASQSHYFDGWWSTATLALVGATAGASRAFGLDADRTAHAIGMAAAGAGVGRCLLGTDAKALFVGETAARAIGFAKAAAAGMTGPVGCFEHPHGFFAMLNRGRSHPEAAGTLGSRWRLREPGLLFKLSPVCSGAHAVIEATSRLVRASGGDVSRIARIHCRVPELVKVSLIFDRPRSPQEAQFSLPYAAACGVLHGRVRLEDLEASEVQSPAKRALMEKVHYEQDSLLSEGEMGRRCPEGARVVLTLASGERFEEFCGEAYGMPGNPLSREDLWKKFEGCAAFAGLSPRETARAASLLSAKAWAGGSAVKIVHSILERAKGATSAAATSRPKRTISANKRSRVSKPRVRPKHRR